MSASGRVVHIVPRGGLAGRLERELGARVIALEDDVSRGPVVRADFEGWSAARAAIVAERQGSTIPAAVRAYRRALGRIQSIVDADEVVFWCGRDDPDRLWLGLAARVLVPSPPEDAGLRFAWVDREDEAGGDLAEVLADRVATSLADLTEYAYAFEVFVATRAGQSVGGAASRLPEQVETERLILRAPAPGDGAELYRAVRESEARLEAFMVWVGTHGSPADSEASCRDARLAFLAREDMQLRGFLRATGELCLSTGFHRVDWAEGSGAGPRLEIGYWVRTSCEGQGYVTEAVGALTQVAFETLGARRVEIRCAASNARSRRVPERLGYELEATLSRSVVLPSGAVDDQLVFVRLS